LPLIPGHELFSGFSLDSSRFLTAERGGILRVWDLQDQGLLSASPLPAPPGSMAISPDGTTLAWGNAEGEVFQKPVATQEAPESRALVSGKGHSAPVTFVKYSDKGETLISAAEDGSLRLWDLSGSGGQVNFRNDLGVLREAMLSVDGQVLASSGVYGARVWNARTGEPRFDVPSLGSAPVIALRHDGSQLLVQSGEGDLQVRDTQAGELLRTIAFGRAIRIARFSPDDRFLVLADRSGALSVWRSEDYVLSGAPVRLGGEVIQVSFVPGGNALVARTHNWMHLLALTSNGLHVRASRLIESPGGSNSFFFPERSGEVVTMANAQRGGEPLPQTLYFDARDGDPANGDAAGMLGDWSQRLGLAIAEDGALVPRSSAGSDPGPVPVSTVVGEL